MNNFKIVVPVYNSESWIEKCIESVLDQSNTNWKMVVLDDYSSDSTWSKIQKYSSDKITVIRNKNNLKPLGNIVKGISLLCSEGNDIVINLDGDDWLYSNTVLEYLDSVYDNNIWLTYGSYIILSKNILDNCNRKIEDTKRYRKSGQWLTSHLRTYRYSLFSRIKDEDLRYKNKYLQAAGDAGLMFPMVEMAGNKRIKYINKPLYVYNDTNPINEHKASLQLQLQMAKYIRNKPVYKEVQ